MTGVLISVDSRTDKAQRDLDQINSSLRTIEKSTSGVTENLAKMAKGLAAVAVSGFSLAYLTDVASEYTNLSNKIKLVVKDTDQLAEVQEDLLKIVNKTRSSLNATVRTFTAFTKTGNGAARNVKDVMRATEAVQKALAISGQSAEASAAAVMQLGQAMASGVLRGEEFNSIMEQATPIMQMVADSMGITLGKLRQMSMEGKLLSDTVFSGILSQSEKIAKQFEKIAPTLSQGYGLINNNMKQLTHTFDQLVGASSLMGRMLGITADKIVKLNDYLMDNGEILISTAMRALSMVHLIAAPIASIFITLAKHAKNALGEGFLTNTLSGELRAVARLVDKYFGGFFTDTARSIQTRFKLAFSLSSPVQDAMMELRKLSPDMWLTGGLDKETLNDFFSVDTLYAYATAFDHLAIALKGNSEGIAKWIPDALRQVEYSFQDILRYFGMLPSTLFTFREGKIEALTDSLAELMRGLLQVYRPLDDFRWLINQAFGNSYAPLVSALEDAIAVLPIRLEQAMLDLARVALIGIQRVAQIVFDYIREGSIIGPTIEFGFEIPDAKELNASVVKVFDRLIKSAKGYVDKMRELFNLDNELADRLLDGFAKLGNVFSFVKFDMSGVKKFVEKVVDYITDMVARLQGKAQIKLEILDFNFDVFKAVAQIFAMLSLLMIGIANAANKMEKQFDALLQSDFILKLSMTVAGLTAMYQAVVAVGIATLKVQGWMAMVAGRVLRIAIVVKGLMTMYNRYLSAPEISFFSDLADSIEKSFPRIASVLRSIERVINNAIEAIFTSLSFKNRGRVKDAIAGIATFFSEMVSGIAQLLRGEGLSDTFIAVYDKAKDSLNSTVGVVKDFADKVIHQFFRIYDAVIGHSWWTDTVETVESTSHSLWDKAGPGIINFKNKVIGAFKGVFEEVQSAMELLANADTDKLSKEMPNAIKAVLSGLAGVGVAVLFPPGPLKTAIMAALVSTFASSAVMFSEAFANSVFGESFVGASAAAIGEVLGVYSMTILREVPKIIGGLAATMSGLFRGFIGEVPMIGTLTESLFKIADLLNLSGPLGLIGSILMGTGVAMTLRSLNIFRGQIDAIQGVLTAMLLTLFPGGANAGMGFAARFFGTLGPVATIGFIGTLLAQLGALDSLFGSSSILKTILSGGLLAMFTLGSLGSANANIRGALMRTIGTPILSFIAGLTQSMGNRMTVGIMGAVFGFVRTYSFWIFGALALLTAGFANAEVKIKETAQKTTTWADSLYKTFDAAWASPFLTTVGLITLTLVPRLIRSFMALGASIKASFANATPGPVVNGLRTLGSGFAGARSLKGGLAIGAAVSTMSDPEASMMDVVTNTMLGYAAGSIISKAVPSVMARLTPMLAPILGGLSIGVISTIAGTGAAIVGGFAAIMALWKGEGEGFMEKLQDVWYKGLRWTGLGSGTNAEIKYGSKIEPENRKFGDFEAKYDFSKVDLNRVPDRLQNNMSRLLEEQNENLTRAREMSEAGRVIPPELIDSIKRLDATIEKGIDRMETAGLKNTEEMVDRLRKGQELKQTNPFGQIGKWVANHSFKWLEEKRDDFQIARLRRSDDPTDRRIADRRDETRRSPGYYNYGYVKPSGMDKEIVSLFDRLGKVEEIPDDNIKSLVENALRDYEIKRSRLNQPGVFGGAGASLAPVAQRDAEWNLKNSHTDLQNSLKSAIDWKSNYKYIKDFQDALTATKATLNDVGVSMEDSILFGQSDEGFTAIMKGSKELDVLKKKLALTKTFTERNAIVVQIQKRISEITVNGQQSHDIAMKTPQKGAADVAKRLSLGLDDGALAKLFNVDARELRKEMHDLEDFKASIIDNQDIADIVFPPNTDTKVISAIRNSNSRAMLMSFLDKLEQDIKAKAKTAYKASDYLAALASDTGIALRGEELNGYSDGALAKRLGIADKMKDALAARDQAAREADSAPEEEQVAARQKLLQAERDLADTTRRYKEDLSYLVPLQMNYNDLLNQTASNMGLSSSAMQAMSAADQKLMTDATRTSAIIERELKKEFISEERVQQLRGYQEAISNTIDETKFKYRGLGQTLNDVIQEIGNAGFGALSLDNIFSLDPTTLESVRKAGEYAAKLMRIMNDPNMSFSDKIAASRDLFSAKQSNAALNESLMTPQQRLSGINSTFSAQIDALAYSKNAVALDKLYFSVTAAQRAYEAGPTEANAKRMADAFKDASRRVTEFAESQPGMKGRVAKYGRAGVSTDGVSLSRASDSDLKYMDALASDILIQSDILENPNLTEASRQAAANMVAQGQNALAIAMQAATMQYVDSPVYQAGQTFADNVKSAFSTGLKGVLNGTTSFKDFVSELASSFAENVINTVVDGFMSNFSGKDGILSKMGASLAGAGHSMFDADKQDAFDTVAINNFNAALTNFTNTFGLGMGTTPGFVSPGMSAGTDESSSVPLDANAMQNITNSTNMTFATKINELGGLISGNFQSLPGLLSGLFAMLSTSGSSGSNSSGIFGIIAGAIGLFSGGGSASPDTGVGSGFNSAMWGLTKAAEGGLLSGPGTGTSDSIPLWGSNGEFMVNARDTKKHRGLLEQINSGKMPRYADGGIIGGNTSFINSSNKAIKSASVIPNETKSTQVFNLHITGDVSRQTRAEIQKMIPQIATGVNMHNYEQGSRR